MSVIVIVPAALAAYFIARGAWAQLRYCVFEFNAQIASNMPPSDILVKRLSYIPVLALILWIAWLRRPQSEDSVVLWRFFLAFTSAFFTVGANAQLVHDFIATVIGFWVLVSSRDGLVIFPILVIFFAAAIDRLDIRIPLFAATSLIFAGGIWFYTDHFRNGTEEHITMMRQVLGLTHPEDPILDLKGETIYRRRPYYYIFEFISRRAMRQGLIIDTIPEDVVRAQCHVAQADGPFFPPRGRAFLRENFLDMGRLRAAGQWITDDGSFTISVPGVYVILNDRGEAQGALDGSPYRGQRLLDPGSHTFVTTGMKERFACLWAPAYQRGYSPFHLRDREFAGSPVFDTAGNDSGSASRRRRHRSWGPAPTHRGAGR